MIALHLLDPATPDDALDMLALLIGRSGGVRHRVLVLGHQNVVRRACAAGVPAELIRVAHSMGWADPAGWRAVRMAVRKNAPTHVHAWGLRGAVAATVLTDFDGTRLGTWAAEPSRGGLRLLRVLERRVPWTWTAASATIERALLAGGLTPAQVHCIRPGIAMQPAPEADRAALRRQLGIGAVDGPVLLLGCDEVRAARHDHGLWAAGILLQRYHRTRVLVRRTPGMAGEATWAFARSLQEPQMVISAELPWRTLVRAADILLVSAEGPVGVGSILQAQAAGVPVIGTPIPAVAEVVEHGRTGLLASTRRPGWADREAAEKRGPGARRESPRGVMPRALAARLEEFMSDSTLRWPLTDRARAQVYAEYKVGTMLEAFGALYRAAAVPASKSA